MAKNTSSKKPQELDAALIDAPPVERLPKPAPAPANPPGPEPIVNLMDMPEIEVSTANRSLIQQAYGLLPADARKRAIKEAQDYTKRAYGWRAVTVFEKEYEPKRQMTKKDKNGNEMLVAHGKTAFPDDVLERMLHILAEMMDEGMEREIVEGFRGRGEEPPAYVERVVEKLGVILKGGSSEEEKKEAR